MPGKTMLLRRRLGVLLFRGRDTKAIGAITAVAGPNLIDGEFFTIDDGVGTVASFEFDSNAAFTGDIQVPFTGIDTDSIVAVAIRDAINLANQEPPPGPPAPGNPVGLRVHAFISPADPKVVIVEHDVPGAIGNLAGMTEAVADAGFFVDPVFNFGDAYSDWLLPAELALIDDTGLVQAVPLRHGPPRAIGVHNPPAPTRPLGGA